MALLCTYYNTFGVNKSSGFLEKSPRGLSVSACTADRCLQDQTSNLFNMTPPNRICCAYSTTYPLYPNPSSSCINTQTHTVQASKVCTHSPTHSLTPHTFAHSLNTHTFHCSTTYTKLEGWPGPEVHTGPQLHT
jgi:hypothetical protein